MVRLADERRELARLQDQLRRQDREIFECNEALHAPRGKQVNEAERDRLLEDVEKSHRRKRFVAEQIEAAELRVTAAENALKADGVARVRAKVDLLASERVSNARNLYAAIEMAVGLLRTDDVLYDKVLNCFSGHDALQTGLTSSEASVAMRRSLLQHDVERLFEILLDPTEWKGNRPIIAQPSRLVSNIDWQRTFLLRAMDERIQAIGTGAALHKPPDPTVTAAQIANDDLAARRHAQHMRDLGAAA
jgi:hypothetical protein